MKIYAGFRQLFERLVGVIEVNVRTWIRCGVSVNHFFHFLMVTALAVMAIGFAFFGPSELADSTTLALAFSLYGLLASAAYFSKNTTFPIVCVLTFHITFFYLPRIAQYMLIPEYLSLPFTDGLSIGEINAGLSYILPAVAFFLAGVFVMDRWSVRFVNVTQQPFRNGKWQDPSTAALLVVFGFSVVMELVFILGLNLTYLRPAEAGLGHTFTMAARTLINVDSAYFIVSGIMLFRFLQSGVGLSALILVSGIYLLLTVLAGSKSGIFRIDQILFIVFIVGYGWTRIQWRNLFAIAALTLTLGPLIFFVAQNIRELSRQGSLSDGSVAQLISEPKGVSISMPSKKRSKAISNNQQGFGVDRSTMQDSSFWKSNVEPQLVRILPIMDRFGLSDYSIYVIAHEATANKKDIYFSGAFFGKSLTNILVPGAPFPEASAGSSQLMPVVFRGHGEEFVQTPANFNTEPWTAWGIAKMYFGGLGGLFFLFVAGGVLQALFRVVSEYAPVASQVHAAFFLWGVVMVFFTNFGLDGLVGISVFLALQVILLQIGFRFTDILLSRLNSLRLH